MIVLWLIWIFVSPVAADVPELWGTVRVEATGWVMPVEEGTLTPMPVHLDDGALSPGACQMVARAQPPRQVTVRAHDARMAVVQYHAPGFLDPQECEDGALIQVPAGHVHQWILQAEAQTERTTVDTVLLLVLVALVLLSAARFWLALGRSREADAHHSPAPQGPGDS